MIISSTQSELTHMSVCSVISFELPLSHNPLGADFRFFIGGNADVELGCVMVEAKESVAVFGEYEM